MSFQKATKQQRRLKMALFGPSGSGKTYTALKVAREIAGPEGRIALVDTERSSASLYAEYFDFDTCSLAAYGVDDYAARITEAVKGGYDILIIDSLSHAWEASGGILEEVERIATAKGYRDRMRAWKDVKPIEARLWDAILDADCGVIGTMRAKTAYEISKDEKGKTTVEKLGLAPIQRVDKEYEFDVIGRMTTDNTLVITKTRCCALSGKSFETPGKNVAAILKPWLDDLQANGAPQPRAANSDAPAPEETAPETEANTPPATVPNHKTEVYARINRAIAEHGAPVFTSWKADHGYHSGAPDMTVESLAKMIEKFEADMSEGALMGAGAGEGQ